MTPPEDFWSADDFEDAVTRTLISAYETDLESVDDKGTIGEVNLAHLKSMRKFGVYIPAPDRLVFNNHFDFCGGLPEVACVSSAKRVHEKPGYVGGYIRIVYCRRLSRLPSGLKRSAMGIPYELFEFHAQDERGFIAARTYLILRKDGTAKFQYFHGVLPANLQKISEGAEFSLTSTLQFQEDIQNQWTITTKTPDTKVTIGAYPETVKSVLYARELPVTPTGRKRPILHLVSAHQRRMKSGVDIDIAEFLRGTRRVVMDGFEFTVSPSKQWLETQKK